MIPVNPSCRARDMNAVCSRRAEACASPARPEERLVQLQHDSARLNIHCTFVVAPENDEYVGPPTKWFVSSRCISPLSMHGWKESVPELLRGRLSNAVGHSL